MKKCALYLYIIDYLKFLKLILFDDICVKNFSKKYEATHTQNTYNIFLTNVSGKINAKVS